MAFLSEEDLKSVKYTFTVPLHGRPAPEFSISIKDLKDYSPHEKDNPLLGLLAERLEGEGQTNIIMLVRLYPLTFVVDDSIPSDGELNVIESKLKVMEVVEEFCTIGQQRPAVYSRLTDI